MVQIMKKLDVACSRLEELQSKISEFLGDKYIKFYTHEENIKLYNNDFIMTYHLDEDIYYVSFLVASSGRDIGNLMKVILSVFGSHEIIIIPDFFIDKSTNTLSYGVDAIISKQAEIFKVHGKEKCIICEDVYHIEDISNSICEYCHTNMNSYIWN